MSLSVDAEWEEFLGYSVVSDSSQEIGFELLRDGELENNYENSLNNSYKNEHQCVSETPKPSDIYISTKTKIAHFNQTIDLKNVFWKINVQRYCSRSEGVIKKQMKFNSLEKKDYDEIQDNLKNEYYFDQHVITHIENATGRILFKDIRKVSVGICKKDLLQYRSKKKSAFYNCFVLIIRLLDNSSNYKEYHVKIFNTGKIEIPGVQDDMLFQRVLTLLLSIIQPHVETQLKYKSDVYETVLINSIFKCGYNINRESLYDILKYKYNLQTIYDPCSYPGIQCKFYYNPDVAVQTGSQISEEGKKKFKNINQVSFMIFRTGSVLIVGKCEESVLREIYEFIKNILVVEYKQVFEENTESLVPVKIKKLKQRKHEFIVYDEPHKLL
jgi:hypothetical protein